MPTDELAHLDWLARIDALKDRLAGWAAQPVDWEPLRPAQALVQRLLDRLEPLRLRWEAPLVVATFGGTGTGKSSLVNALVGDDITPAGKERPTTRRPILLAHSDFDLKSCQLPLDKVDVVRRDLPLLRDVLLLDCPDPDTSETDGEATNLGRLHELLPLCDVLLYVSTQQKYRSAKVGDELGKAAESCRLVFIQTHADLDSDIRDDWRTQLEPHYRIADMFFVDSKQALAEQRSGQQPTGDFGRLLTFLSRELAASRRAGIRRANLLDMLDEGLSRSTALVEPSLQSLTELESAIDSERRKLGRALAKQLTEELSTCRNLWQRRLLEQVTQSWGVSPFAGLLRVYQAQATLLASWALTRARSTAQLALWGAWQGARWIGERQANQADEQRLNRLTGIDPALVRAAELTLAGYLHAAHFRKTPVQAVADNAGQNYLAEVTQRLDGVIADLAKRNTGWFTRFVFEIGFLILPTFLFYRIGRNFFYDSFWLKEPLLDLNFYIPAALFLGLWSAFWLWRFLARLRRGVEAEIGKLSTCLADVAALDGVFADHARLAETARRQFTELQGLQQTAAALRQALESDSRLGGRNAVSSERQR